jgi:hypothetical protein
MCIVMLNANTSQPGTPPFNSALLPSQQSTIHAACRRLTDTLAYQEQAAAVKRFQIEGAHVACDTLAPQDHLGMAACVEDRPAAEAAGASLEAEESHDEVEQKAADLDTANEHEPGPRRTRSILKQPDRQGSRVQRSVSWHDFQGKNLHEVKVFEPR